MKVTIEIELPDGQEVPSEYDIVRLTDPDWLVSWWHIDDVKERAIENGDKLSTEQAWKVLSLIDRNMDCNIGINWDVIDYWIEHVLTERKKK